jgi:hypothetical protein
MLTILFPKNLNIFLEHGAFLHERKPHFFVSSFFMSDSNICTKLLMSFKNAHLPKKINMTTKEFSGELSMEARVLSSTDGI